MEVNKNTIGQVFFILSILTLIYMLINPLTQVITDISEFFTLTIINFPISDLLHILGGDTNPPLYFLFLKGLSKLTTDFAILKVFSIIPYAIILIFSTIKLRKDYGWLAAGLFAFATAIMSQFFISYTILRPYSWAMLFTLLSFVYFKDIINLADKKSFVLFTVFSILASYTHYYGLIITIVLYLILLFHMMNYNKDKIKYLAASIIAGIIFYAPWILTLIKILESMQPLGKINVESIIQSLAHFTYSGDTFFSIVSLLIFLLILALYLKENDNDKISIIYGIIAYFATIAIILLISVIIKPIFVMEGLILASAILWLVISIMISKMQNKRIFFISLALICLLLVSGIGTLIVTNDEAYQNGLKQSETLDEILEEDNSMIILNNPGLALYFLDFSNQSEMYCVNQDYVYGENMNRIHEIFDFKNIDKTDMRDLATNNTDKNIYLISWGNPNVDLNVSQISKKDGIVISKVNTTSLKTDEYYEYY
ncbi:hypothetical protein [Methanobrevibacter sp.]|uniref:hypothetical protein n=1 Tax=Methanobrevibacter sp. TaxID=66852 RepID=UPI003891080C